VVKGLTPEELDKTEGLAKACKDILKSEREALIKKLSFGVAAEKQNVSAAAGGGSAANRVAHQLDLRPSYSSRAKRAHSSERHDHRHRHELVRRNKLLSVKVKRGFSDGLDSDYSSGLHVIKFHFYTCLMLRQSKLEHLPMWSNILAGDVHSNLFQLPLVILKKVLQY